MEIAPEELDVKLGRFPLNIMDPDDLHEEVDWQVNHVVFPSSEWAADTDWDKFRKARRLIQVFIEYREPIEAHAILYAAGFNGVKK